jgi:hypothetical protein
VKSKVESLIVLARSQAYHPLPLPILIIQQC